MTVRPSTDTGAPRAASARSVWSRVAAGSVTVVSPSAAMPASRMALFTWAVGTGSVAAMPYNGPPTTSSGACPSVVVTAAPIARSGSATRSIGRADRLSSPTSTERNGAAASVPASSRIEVPELPQSSGPAASVSAERPSPSTSSAVRAVLGGVLVPRGTVTLGARPNVASPSLE